MKGSTHLHPDPAVNELIDALPTRYAGPKRAYIKGLIKLARQAGAANPTLLGNQLGLLFEGAAALSTSLNDPTPWTHARKAAATLIDQAAS